LSSTAVSAFLDAIQARPGLELHSLMILRHGMVVADGWWHPYERDQLHLLFSLSKSFTSTAAGLAAAEGLLSLDDRVIDIFDEHADVATDERVRATTLRQLARMASGHREDALSRAFAHDHHDLVRGFLQVPPDEEPGSIFAYNNAATFVLGAAVQKVSGQTLTDFLTPRLFSKIGIDRFYWQTDTMGRNLGFTGLHLTTESIGRFGQLILQGGRWGDEQILDPQWLELATSKQTDNAPGSDGVPASPDWRQGYGYQFWMCQHGFRGDGAHGQFCIMLPEQDMVIAITAATKDLQGVLDQVWAELLPGCADQPLTEDHQAAAALTDRLSALSLAAPGAPGWAPQPLTEPTDDSPAPPIRISSIEESGPDELALSIIHDHPQSPQRPVPLRAATPLAVQCGLGHWVISETDLLDDDHGPATLRCAASAVRESDGTLVVEIIFLNTPHRLRLRHRADVTEAGWIIGPMMAESPEQLAIHVQST
jgi:CubicO group peptidase (beta-lactamase class C family)